MHHHARIVGHVARDVPPLHTAFLIPRRVSLRGDHKRQTVGCHRSVAHRFASLPIAPGMQLSHSGCPAALCSSDCKSVSIPATLALAFLEAIPAQHAADVQSTNALARVAISTAPARHSSPSTFPASPRTRFASFGNGSSDRASDKPSGQIGQNSSVDLRKQFCQALRRGGAEGRYLAAHARRSRQGVPRQRLDQPQRVQI